MPPTQPIIKYKEKCIQLNLPGPNIHIIVIPKIIKNQSIQKRTKLLSNENYINKAPQNIVETDRQKLKEEQEKLLILEKQL